MDCYGYVDLGSQNQVVEGGGVIFNLDVQSISMYGMWGILRYISILLMEEILHRLRCIKPCKQWDELPINWCRISSINSIIISYSIRRV